MPLTLREIVEHLGGEAVGEVAEPLTGVATLDSAGPRDIAFLANPKYRSRLASTAAGAVILGRGDRDTVSLPRIVADNPYAYYARTVALFHPEQPAAAGVHASAHVDA
ncbi:MAG: LpxD N-terminal domain-containing protein, partial [Bacillota bacterium]